MMTAPVVLFDREDPLQDQYLRRRSRRRLSPPRCYVPGSGAFVEAVQRGLGWGMVPDLQASADDGGAPLVEFDARGDRRAAVLAAVAAQLARAGTGERVGPRPSRRCAALAHHSGTFTIRGTLTIPGSRPLTR
jgi:DNA-binding transcriptional LysR family regulator